MFFVHSVTVLLPTPLDFNTCRVKADSAGSLHFVSTQTTCEPETLRCGSNPPTPYIIRSISRSLYSHYQTIATMPSFSVTITLLLLPLLLLLHISPSVAVTSATQSADPDLPTRRLQFLDEDPSPKPPIKKKLTLDTKNQTKLLKPKKSNSTSSSLAIKPNKFNSTIIKQLKSNSTKLKTMNSNSTLLKPKKFNSTTLLKPKKLNSTTLLKPKKSNSTMSITKMKNATSTATAKTTKIVKPTTATKPPATTLKSKLPTPWFDSDDIDITPDDLISDFRDLPARIIPDLSRLSTTSKAYIARANSEIAKGVKPYVGHKYAAATAAAASAALLVLPLLFLTLLFHRIKTYLTLQRLLIFIQAYLAIYFATLAVTALATGLEPLRFFAAASPPSYAVVQAIQTLGYVVYLVVQMLHVVSGGEGRWLGVAQMVVGVAVGVHYYAAVFHRAVAGEPPRANWKVHAVYAACFVVICACAKAERRKKAYVAGGGGEDDGKKS